MYDMETVIRLDESVRQDLRHSQIRTLLTLLISSFIVYYWYTSLLEVFARGYFTVSRSLAILPPLLNAVSWLIWGSLHYVLFIKGTIRKRGSPSDTSEILDEHQFNLFQHNRQRRIETLIGFVTAFQMFCMALYTAYAQFIVR